jgi:hypothetical protein
MVIVFFILMIGAIAAPALNARWLITIFLIYTLVCASVMGALFFRDRHLKTKWVRLPGPPGKNDPGSGENKDTKI